jgi:hypothetical protein
MRCLRFAAPHRILAPFIVGAAFALHEAGYGGRGEGLVVQQLDVSPIGHVVILAVLVVSTVTLLRVWALQRASSSSLAQSLIMGVAGVGGGGALVLLVSTGNVVGSAAFAVLLANEWLFLLPPVSLAERVAAEPGAIVTEGLLAPLLGISATGFLRDVPWSFLIVMLLLAGGLGSVAFVREPVRSHSSVRSLAGSVSPLLSAIVSLLLVTAAIAMVLAGAGPRLRPERALLATPVAIMAVVFGWLALADPRPESRYLRVERLLTTGGLALHAGLVLVLMFS